MAILSTPGLVVLETQQDLFAYLEAMVQQQQQDGQHGQQLEQASVFLECLVSEFGKSQSAVTYRMPLEFHKLVHKSYETQGSLFRSLQLAITALSQVVTTISASAAASATSWDAQADTAVAVVHLTTSVLGWEFGTSAWDATSNIAPHNLIRPPIQWKEVLGGRDGIGLVQAVFRVHEIVASSSSHKNESLAQLFRQLLLQLASVSGPIFNPISEQRDYASCFCEGTLQLLQRASEYPNVEESFILHETLQIMARLVANFRLSLLIELPPFLPLLQGLNHVGNMLLTAHIRECESVGGDVDSMAHYSWREDAIVLVLDAAVLLSSDAWLWHGGNESSRYQAQSTLAAIMGSLYEGFVACRTRMSALEEFYQFTHDAELDEVREEIEESALQDERESSAAIGRLDLSSAISCLSKHFESLLPRLRLTWETKGCITPNDSAILEEARFLTIYVYNLLTDSNEGESPTIPDAVVASCCRQENLVSEIASAVNAMVQLADTQLHAIKNDPTNEKLSPLLAAAFLTFLYRWVPTYVYPADYGASLAENRIVHEWSSRERAAYTIEFSISSGLSYLCCWPQEPLIQEAVVKTLMSLAKRAGKFRSAMVSSSSFGSLVRIHYFTATIRHSVSQPEFESILRTKANEGSVLPLPLLWGYHRLPYKVRAQVASAIIVACSDTSDESASAMMSDALKAIQDLLHTVVQTLSTNQFNSDDVIVRENACLCVELFGGIAQTSEMAGSERIPQFISPYLPQISGLMTFYAKDLTISTSLLRFFRDYSVHFIAVLDSGQSLVLFQACAELLKRYSEIHCCSSRHIIQPIASVANANAEEDQAYQDILYAIQILINLGTKDFIDACNEKEGDGAAVPVTDIIFFGLQQLLPLMTQGLLQYPILCSQFFELVGFMMDTYPEKVCALSMELFDALLESLLFGMSHHDTNVAKSSLHGLASIVREHLGSAILRPALEQSPDLLDKCSRRLLSEVVFQPIVVDRVEASGMALLPLAACSLDRFSNVVRDLLSTISDTSQRHRLEVAFSKLIQPEVVARVTFTGYEGRMNRIRFKTDFEVFVNEVHAFLVLK